MTRRRALSLVATAAFLGCGALAADLRSPAPAVAAAGEHGASRLVIGKRAFRILRRQGIRLRAARPARRRGRRVTLPVGGGEVGGIATLRHDGAVRLRRKRSGRRARRARVDRIGATISPGSSHLTARIGGRQYTLARLRRVGRAPFDPTSGEVEVARARVRLGRAARRALRRKLRVRRIPARLGWLTTDATVEVPPPPDAEPDPGGRPAGAVEVEDASIRWRVRESFICYIHAQGGPGASARDGAVAEPPVAYPPPHLTVPCSGAPSEPLSYTFAFPVETFAEGWFDPGSGQLALRSGGTVNLAKDVFGIDLDVSNPEVELAGEDSRFISTYTDNAAEPPEPRRAVTADLDPGATPSVATEPDGDRRHTYERIAGTVPDGPTASPLAGYYLPGDPFGWVSVSFTVPAGGAGS